ncbi:related to ceramidase [Rhynchosporium agropyri]|uniref:Neutral ceramidase n=1 Tax=Rhynchosporium agropyri TaxID=914238 RepID=A0A1E1KJG2_9HELO|nr:related to ceramidase [Rhynchosporium agropyri]
MFSLVQKREYQALPEQEKHHDSETQIVAVPVRSHGKCRKFHITVASLIIVTLLAFVGIASAWINSPGALPEVHDAMPMDDESREYLAKLGRAADQQYLLGVGKADITGPVVEVGFMGYAVLEQVGTGLRQRVYSRAYIIGSMSNPDDRFVYLVLDIANGDTAIRYGVINGLKDASLGIYNQSNIALTGTHSHSGPGAYNNYLLPQITSLGFSKQSYQAIVDGTILSIQRAHASLAPGYLKYGDTNITDANINRSLYAYLANPAAERAKYDSTVDTTLTLLRFKRASDGLNTGVLAWHSVHGTSALANNTHVTGDNKGLSSYLFEKAALNDPSAAPGFVAAFSQSSVGDTTPNVLGAWCDDGSGTQCTFEKSTCGGTSQACHGRGPAFQKLDLGISSCYEIGRRVYAGAQSLYDSMDSVGTAVAGSSVKFYHTFQDMQYFQFKLPNGTTVQTCPAALGAGFAAGTSDWPGAFDFTQANNDSQTQNPFWVLVRDVLTKPSAKTVACHSPKPILLDVGEMHAPYDWSPNIVDIQSFRVGNLFMIISPGEATTMTGRRWKAAVAAAAISKGITTFPKVVLGGPANTYAHYIATPEEYGIQRYEGASTLFGPWTSNAHIYLSEQNIGYLVATNTSQPASGTLPPNNFDNSISLITDVVWDSPIIGKSFGQIITQPKASYPIGSGVSATFVGANPRNNLRLEGTFAEVQMKINGAWTKVRDDSDWFLVYTWERLDGLIGSSQVVLSWETESYAAKGTYRFKYYGDSKQLGGKITAFTGTSNEFTLV